MGKRKNNKAALAGLLYEKWVWGGSVATTVSGVERRILGGLCTNNKTAEA